MINHIKKIMTLSLAIVVFASCADSKATTQEQAELNTMDSVSKAAKESADKVAEQTSKVEASLEKLDAEFKVKN